MAEWLFMKQKSSGLPLSQYSFEILNKKGYDWREKGIREDNEGEL